MRGGRLDGKDTLRPQTGWKQLLDVPDRGKTGRVQRPVQWGKGRRGRALREQRGQVAAGSEREGATLGQRGSCPGVRSCESGAGALICWRSTQEGHRVRPFPILHQKGGTLHASIPCAVAEQRDRGRKHASDWLAGSLCYRRCSQSTRRRCARPEPPRRFRCPHHTRATLISWLASLNSYVPSLHFTSISANPRQTAVRRVVGRSLKPVSLRSQVY